MLIFVIFLLVSIEVSGHVVFGGYTVNEGLVNEILESETVYVDGSPSLISTRDKKLHYLAKSPTRIFNVWHYREIGKRGFRIPRWHPLHKKINKVYANLSKHME